MNTVSPSPASTQDIVATLEVISGLHRGAVIEWRGAACHIGADESADVWLGDAGISPEHTILRFHGRQMAVEAAGGDITVADQTVREGTGLRCESPVTIRLGNATIRISRPTPPPLLPKFPRLPGMPPRLKRSLNRSAPVMALIVTLGVLGLYEFVDVNQAGANIGSFEPLVTVDEQAIRGARQLVADAEPGPATALRDHLAAAGLNAMTVSRHDRYLSVSGHYDQGQKSAWDETQRWFDQRFGSRHVLLNSVTARSTPSQPDLQLSAVWLGENPYVIDRDGKRLYPGAALPSGWVVSAIDDQRVLLRHGDEQFSLTL
ncbi:SctD/MshK family protein [Salinicola rhizosphaerae]|uniref:YscD cytoplasmic domain-containing protein n=1 Tax=Salinicola rhizosphaerae TaxID=1443141 RepID=A0ABQ3DT85_9GAMM|nr:EscD/YscD/HrpQ family type III secretion system periplasmic domain-containing protein [Salinicola rhizosphaerae]GHB11801.1 hypothetical protein GCM10009038_06700 [Salinicola rhizosphaerae]